MPRDQFPALQKSTYLNTAGGAPIPLAAHAAAVQYYQESLEDGDVYWNTWLERTDNARREVGELVGASARHVAFLGNASAGLNLVADLDEPGVFASADSEFPSCTLPWLRRGFKHARWRTREDGAFDVDDIARVAGNATVLVVSWVQFASGFRADLAAISDFCASRGIRLVVDGTQAVGAFPLDATELGIDALVFSGYKWLTAGYGVAGLVMPKGLPELGSPHAGWRSQVDPFDLRSDVVAPGLDGAHAEAGHPPFPAVFSLGASAALWNGQGTRATSQRILSLVGHLNQGLERIGVPVLSPSDPRLQSGIVLLDVKDPADVARQLSKRGIVTSARRAGLRVSVHAYNTADELDLLVGELAGILGR
ncbi:MAG: aminotransferase class V-fold PLP-dependent enzyme [Rhodothermales bacterium]|nr:aminotransferase class V-fold PLP-dependent enzyme [Rhodothermales bacterium]